MGGIIPCCHPKGNKGWTASFFLFPEWKFLRLLYTVTQRVWIWSGLVAYSSGQPDNYLCLPLPNPLLLFPGVPSQNKLLAVQTLVSGSAFWGDLTVIVRISEYCIFFFNYHFFFFFLFRATPVAYRSFRAKGQIRAAAADLCHSHSHAGSKLHLQPTPQLAATPNP